MKNVMFWKGKDQQQEALLERLSRRVVRAAEASEQELEAALSAPFLYARIRAVIAEKQRAEAEVQEFSFSMWVVMRQAVPLMILSAFVSVMLLFGGTWRGTNTLEETAMATLGASIDRVVMDEDNLPLSSDEVLSTIIAGHPEEDTGEGDER